MTVDSWQIEQQQQLQQQQEISVVATALKSLIRIVCVGTLFVKLLLCDALGAALIDT